MRATFGAGAAVSAALSRCRTQQRAALIAFLVAGDPNSSQSADLVAAAVSGGADIIELGIPFSDPLADGPTIQAAADRALRAGMTMSGALELGRTLKPRMKGAPLLGFTYYNLVVTRGLTDTARDFAASGFAGIIVPDLPFGEAQPLIDAFAAFGLVVPMLVAPTTSIERAAHIASASTGFVYVVSRMGVTGSNELGSALEEQIKALRRVTDTPLAVGFGVTGRDRARRISHIADGVVVGSALIERAACARSHQAATAAVHDACRELSLSCRREGHVA